MSANVNNSLNALDHPPTVKEHYTARELRLMRAAYHQGREDEAAQQARAAKVEPRGDYGRVAEEAALSAAEQLARQPMAEPLTEGHVQVAEALAFSLRKRYTLNRLKT